MQKLVPGQRYLSNAEPELGLGTILRLDGRMLQVLFARSGTLRQYALQSAPLTRVSFRPGDRINAHGRVMQVEQVTERDSILYYKGGTTEWSESELDDLQNVSKAEDRLAQGRVDRNDQFEFRVEALKRRAEARRSRAFGLESARVDLIPHQLRVAEIVGDRRPPRVLLADEVGLGKTIEAGMIVARQLATGRATRVLVLVPEPLVYQWFVEMLRRFNLSFSIFDEERVEAIEAAGDGRNPFKDEQLIITDTEFLVSSPERAKMAVQGEWDLLVVDEAHHLAWSPEAESPEYVLVEALAKRVAGVVLLTATPEQLGRSGHFARLRLLDPARYHDLEKFQQETALYAQRSKLAAKIADGRELEGEDRHQLHGLLGKERMVSASREELLGELIDRHGTGRVMFRNRRAIVGGFPARLPEVDTLPAPSEDDELRGHLLAEFLSDVDAHPHALPLSYSKDPRLDWLVQLIESMAQEKFLVICRSQAKVLALEEALRLRSGVGVARFHEGMSIVQRDRNAAFFQQPDGARVLLCAEIGSEGRNFQFAHHLVLWDLPIDPDQLEQRIGRLDRIGQKGDVHIHFACFADSAQAALARWYDQGLDAFRTSPQDGRELYRRFGAELIDAARAFALGQTNATEQLDDLIGRTQAAHEELAAAIQEGRDRLLELATQRAASEERLRRAMASADHDRTQDDFILKLFEQFGIENEELAERTVVLDPEYLNTEAFPGFENGPRQATFDRNVALTRDDLLFLRVDHPMVQSALDMLLSAETGNATFLVDPDLPLRSAYLDAVFVLECLAPPELHVDRFLPPLPVRVITDSRLKEHADYQASEEAVRRAGDLQLDPAKLRKVLSQLVPPMLKGATGVAERLARRETEAAMLAADTELDAEIARLTALAAINPSVKPQEIADAQSERAELHELISAARLRLDAVRLVVSPDFLNLMK